MLNFNFNFYEKKLGIKQPAHVTVVADCFDPIVLFSVGKK